MEANFYMRMRTGEIPIGVAGYECILSYPPPLRDYRMVGDGADAWPHEKDGVIDRSAGGSSQVAIIMRL